MKKILQFTFQRWTVPLVLLGLTLISFGLLVPFLGFYWDDWSQILSKSVFGVDGYWQYFASDRPTSAWTHVLFAPLLGDVPLRWQLFTLGLRWLTSVAVWWTLSGVWRRQQRQVTFVAMLFAVYPVFTQQSISVAYHQHWTQYLLYWVSLGAMVHAVRQRRLFLPLTLLALATLALHLSITEFFLGAELLRPALLWLTVSQSTQRPLERLKAVLRLWLPYLVVLAGFLIWRLGYINFPDGEPHPLKFFERLAVQPATALLVLFERVVADTTYIILASWSQVIDLDLVNLNRPFTWFSWIAGIATLLGLMVYFHRLRFFANGSEQEGDWCLPAALLGALGVLIGPVPVWVLDDSLLHFFDPYHADRFALASMVGACLLWVACIEWTVQRKEPKIFIFCLGLSLAVGFNLRTANTYRWKWEEQKNLYWQLAWRAPNLEPDTAILAEEILFPYQGLFATASAVNLLYPQPNAPDEMAYWVYSLLPARQHTKPGTVDYHTQMRIFRFETSAQNAVLIMPPAQFSNCLWVLSEHDRHNPYLSDLVKRWLSTSNLKRIQAEPEHPDYPPVDIFGREPAHTWCAYYQKADLARQTENWEQVVRLGIRAQAEGYQPAANSANSPHEWMPFIEGYARAADWDEARRLTLESHAIDPQYKQALCALWQRLDNSSPAGEYNEMAIADTRRELGCQP